MTLLNVRLDITGTDSTDKDPEDLADALAEEFNTERTLNGYPERARVVSAEWDD